MLDYLILETDMNLFINGFARRNTNTSMTSKQLQQGQEVYEMTNLCCVLEAIQTTSQNRSNDKQGHN